MEVGHNDIRMTDENKGDSGAKLKREQSKDDKEKTPLANEVLLLPFKTLTKLFSFTLHLNNTYNSHKHTQKKNPTLISSTPPTCLNIFLKFLNSVQDKCAIMLNVATCLVSLTNGEVGK